MVGPAPSMAQIPLHETLTPLCSGAEDELRRLSWLLEHHRLAADRTAWHWYPKQDGAHDRTYLLVLDATITLFNSGVDWLELTVDIAWRAPGQLAVNAAVEVACWCETDHNMHQVRQAEWPVDSSAALIDAFTASTAMLLVALLASVAPPVRDFGIHRFGSRVGVREFRTRGAGKKRVTSRRRQ